MDFGGFVKFDNSQKPKRIKSRGFTLPSFPIEHLLKIHNSNNTYTCIHCKEARKKHAQKMNYGKFIHQELRSYR